MQPRVRVSQPPNGRAHLRPELNLPPQGSALRVFTLFARALLLRCPVCGRGGIFTSWFRTKRRCPSCGFSLEREEGYFSGAMAVNLVATELILTAVMVTLLVVSWPLAATWPAPPQLQIAWYASIAAAVLLPLL